MKYIIAENMKNESEIRFVGAGSTGIRADYTGYRETITSDNAPVAFAKLEDAQDRIIKDIEEITGINAATVAKEDCQEACVNYDLLQKMLSHDTDALVIDIDRLHIAENDWRIFYIVPICD